MADTDLGVLRRPPRPLEQRLERIARWRAQGLANGAADSTFPGDATDGAVFSAGGSGDSEGVGATGTVQWFAETFDLTSSSTGVLDLAYYPHPWSEVVSLNGIRLNPLTDYTITGSSLTLTDVAALLLGIGSDTWVLAINYAWYDTATGIGIPSDFTDWSYNGDAALVSGVPLLNSGTGSQAGSMVTVGTIATGWTNLTLTLTADIDVSPSNGYGIAFGLLDAAEGETYVGGFSEGLGIGSSGGAPNDTVPCALAWIDTETYYSGAGTDGVYLGSRSSGGSTTVESDAGPFATDGPNTYVLKLTATTAGRASAVLKWNGTTILTSTTDLYVPTTARLIIAAGSGSNHQHVSITAVTAVTDS